MFAVRDEDAALDIVQDAMLKLTEKYADKPAAELPMLFQRILQNTIHDHFRRQKVRSTWTTLLSALGKGMKRTTITIRSRLCPRNRTRTRRPTPRAQLEQGQVVGLIEQALARLPARQREAFLLRYWEELDVAETAAAMGCSEGSVKTHCSRAVHALATMLEAKGREAMNRDNEKFAKKITAYLDHGAADLQVGHRLSAAAGPRQGAARLAEPAEPRRAVSTQLAHALGRQRREPRAAGAATDRGCAGCRRPV